MRSVAGPRCHFLSHAGIHAVAVLPFTGARSLFRSLLYFCVRVAEDRFADYIIPSPAYRYRRLSASKLPERDSGASQWPNGQFLFQCSNWRLNEQLRRYHGPLSNNRQVTRSVRRNTAQRAAYTPLHIPRQAYLFNLWA